MAIGLSRRLVALALGTMLMAMACSSGSSSSAASGGVITLHALFQQQAGYSNDEVNAMTAAFEAANPNIKVQTEFVAYEDILGSTSRGRQAGGHARAVTDIAAAMPLIRRALKLFADREVIPQLGLLKSTLLQLDSSFSEREYGASSFRDFVE